MSDRFPYNMLSRAALVELVRRVENDPDLRDDDVTFEDIFFSPTELEPGRTYIEMVNRLTKIKDWFVFRRLNLSDPYCLGTDLAIKIIGDLTPAAIAEEVNRSMGMSFGPDDVDFSTDFIPGADGNGEYEYEMHALTGSYGYFGKTTIKVTVVQSTRWTRFLESGRIRYLEDGIARELEH